MKRKILTSFLAALFLCVAVSSASYNDMASGEYSVDAELSCYVNAMGGVEFGKSLLTDAVLTVNPDLSRYLTLHFTKSSVTIYGITCDTFIDVSPSYVADGESVKSGSIGYYDSDGNLVTDTVEYTLSSDTAENARGETVHYVDSMSFPLDYESDSYMLTLYVNSNVMGTQFSNDTYPAVLTLDMSSAVACGDDGFESDFAMTDSPETSNNEVSDAGADVEDDATKPIADETRDGLNIYRADSGDKSASDSDDIGVSYMASFKKPLLIAVGAISILLIIIGGVITASAGKDKKDRK